MKSDLRSVLWSVDRAAIQARMARTERHSRVSRNKDDIAGYSLSEAEATVDDFTVGVAKRLMVRVVHQ